MAGKAALLIDADNISADAMQQALAHLREQSLDVCVRRAYGSFETLAVARDFIHSQSVRAIVNHGKSTTDAALVVDAMDLLHAGALPQLVAIASGDADFAPLVVRLREAGKRVICYAQKTKASDGLDRFYAEVILIHDGSASVSKPKSSDDEKAPATARTAARKPAVRKTAAKTASPSTGKTASKSAAKSATKTTAKAATRTAVKTSVKAVAKKAARAPASKAAKAPEPAVTPSVTDQVRRVLESFAGFAEGRDVELGAVSHKLRELGLMSKSATATRFLAQHAPDVELTPVKQPHKLNLRPRA